MKKLLPYIVLVAMLSSCSSTIYLVRHAEKGTTPPNDPDLTATGQARANILRDSLLNKGITSIFASQVRRTQQTAQPLATALNKTVLIRNASVSNNLIDSLKNIKGKKYLIVGHSNTVPDMLRHIGLTPSMQIIPDDTYNYFFKVHISWFWGRTIRLTETRYGPPSP
jgi:2,3-bisphosphoglycerate-dependent phosphoglycerate mutase